jgi:hypothetical protein
MLHNQSKPKLEVQIMGVLKTFEATRWPLPTTHHDDHLTSDRTKLQAPDASHGPCGVFEYARSSCSRHQMLLLLLMMMMMMMMMMVLMLNNDVSYGCCCCYCAARKRLQTTLCSGHCAACTASTERQERHEYGASYARRHWQLV